MKNSFFTARMKLSDVVAANHTLILVLPRLGIPLGFGELSVQEVCSRYGLPVDFVLLVFNVYTFDDYLPDEDDLQRTDFSLLVPYLKASHRYYLDERLPHIERHLVHVAGHAGIFATTQAYMRLCQFYLNTDRPLLQSAVRPQPGLRAHVAVHRAADRDAPAGAPRSVEPVRRASVCEPRNNDGDCNSFHCPSPFALTLVAIACVPYGMSTTDIIPDLAKKSIKIHRRQGDAPQCQPA